MKFHWKDLLFASLCTVMVGFLTWANATGYVLFGAATKHTPSHSSAQYHK